MCKFGPECSGKSLPKFVKEEVFDLDFESSSAISGMEGGPELSAPGFKQICQDFANKACPNKVSV